MKLDIFNTTISVCYNVYLDSFSVIFDNGYLHRANSSGEIRGGVTYKIITLSTGFYMFKIKDDRPGLFVYPEFHLMENHWLKSAREFLENNLHFLKIAGELKQYFEPDDPQNKRTVYISKFVTAEIPSLFDSGYFDEA